MPCYKPVKAWYGNKLASGKREIVFSSGQAQSCLGLALPCNTCIGCYLERARQWAMRCVDEASMYQDNSFITLSVDPEHMREHGRSVDIGVLQKFFKRFRKEIAPLRIRFFAALEYGSKFGRPHYHSLIFNYSFPDKTFFKKTESGEMIFRSAQLERLWPLGFSSVGELTFGSAAYVARYNVKKIGGVVDRDHYLDKRTGEILAPERIVMSRRPGIGAGWYDKFKSDVYPRDVRVIKGVDTKPCKFYDARYADEDPMAFERLKLRRMVRASGKAVDNTEDRLLVKEKVKLAQISALSNNLEGI